MYFDMLLAENFPAAIFTYLVEGGLDSQPERQLHASQSSMYFDVLPSDIFPTIIKYVFLQTNSKGELDLEEDIGTPAKRRQRILNLSMLVSDDSPFRDMVSQLSLAEVKLGQVSDTSRLWMDNSSLVIGPDLFENEGLQLGVPERIFQLSGKSVKVVSICIHWIDLPPGESEKNGVVQKFVTLVKMYCPNVESLRFTSFATEDNLDPFIDSVPELLAEFSSQLSSIEWNADKADENCLRLPDISMCSRIRKLEFPASSQLSSCLQTCGASLESLTVSFGDTNEYVKMLDIIQQNCTKLSTVSLWDSLRVIEKVGERRYTRFLCSFGSQLIGAEIEGLSIEKLTKVVRTCPNLLIASEYVNERGGDDWERVSLLGPMIKRLSVAAAVCRDEKFEELIGKCTNLESLTIEEDYPDEVQEIENCSDVKFLSFLSSYSLTKLCYFGFTASQQNICTLSSAFRNLHYLYLELVILIESGTDFKTIAHSNPHLNSVSIHEYNYDVEEREKGQSMVLLRMLMRAFSKCRSINFDLDHNGEESITRDEIQDICGLLPCRGVDLSITVGSTSYRQSN